MVQRYESTEWGQMDADSEGGWVSYLDHVAEVERVHALKYNQVKGWQDMLQARAYGLGAEAMRAACIAEALAQQCYEGGCGCDRCGGLADFIAALREVQP